MFGVCRCEKLHKSIQGQDDLSQVPCVAFHEDLFLVGARSSVHLNLLRSRKLPFKLLLIQIRLSWMSAHEEKALKPEPPESYTRFSEVDLHVQGSRSC